MKSYVPTTVPEPFCINIQNLTETVKLLQRKYWCDIQIVSPEQRKIYQNYFLQTLDFSYKCGGPYLCNVPYFTRDFCQR